MDSEYSPEMRKMDEELALAKLFDAVRDQASINASLLHAIVRIAGSVALQNNKIVSELLTSTLALVKQHDSKINEIQKILIKIHDITDEDVKNAREAAAPKPSEP